MAAVNTSSSGFSYAQAAKGRSPAMSAQASVSKAAPNGGSSIPPTPVAVPELPLNGSSNWADDVEATVAVKSLESLKSAAESGKSGPSLKESAVDRAKSEEKAQHSTSGISSPDLAATPSTTTRDDDSLMAHTNVTSSETTSDTKSQASEPAWIAERKERQARSQESESTAKADQRAQVPTSSIQPPTTVKPVVLQDAPPPAVNPWVRRAEEAKARAAAAPPSPVKAAPPNAPTEATPLKDNQRPRGDSRRKANSFDDLPRAVDAPSAAPAQQRKSNSFQGKRGDESRAAHQGFKSEVGEMPAVASSRTTPHGRTKASTLQDSPPAVNDEALWPTPETTQDKARKETATKPLVESTDEETMSSSKPKKKQEWQTLAVTPNILWETPNIKRPPTERSSGDRGARGTTRGRGGGRGSAPQGDRATHRNGTAQMHDGNVASSPRGRSNTLDREAMPPPPKPNRPSSETARRDGTGASRFERSNRGQGTIEPREFSKPAKSDTKDEQRDPVSTWVEEQSAIPRTKSPNQIEPAVPDELSKDAERVPDPIPRQGAPPSAGPQEAPERATQDAPPIRMVPSDARRESRGFESHKEPLVNGTARGNKRSGRGRGGARDFTNGHPANGQPFSNDFAATSYYGMPPSPSAFPPARGTHFAYPSHGRGTWPRGNPRAQSIPMEGYYPRNGYSYQPNSQLPPIQTYHHSMYDYGYPMTALPYQPYMEQQYVLSMVSMQLDYYFSIDNLLKDMYLRKNMDSQGFVFLDVVANFNRMKQLTQDRNVLREACMLSESIEIRVGDDGKERLRRREGYEQFLLPMDRREPSAQNDGPSSTRSPERSGAPPQSPAAARAPASAGAIGAQQRFDRRSYEGNYPHGNGMTHYATFVPGPEAAFTDTLGGEDQRGRAAKSPIRETNISLSHISPIDDSVDSEPDSFADDQMSTLLLITRAKKQVPYHTASARTFSNGSIDSRSIFGEIEKPPVESHPGAASTNGDVPGTDGVAPGGSSGGPSVSTRAFSPTKAHSLDRALSNSHSATLPEIYWMKEQTSPSTDLPRDATHEPYVTLRLKALEQREQASTGTCPYDLQVLYQFWSHFLVRNFNSRMYNEFKYYAMNDAQERLNYTGLQNLVTFYSHALLSPNPIRDRVVKDYVEMAKSEPTGSDGKAFATLRSAWRNGALNLKNRKKVINLVDADLKAKLDAE